MYLCFGATGKVGAPVFQPNQFLYFDILELKPENAGTNTMSMPKLQPHRDSDLISLFGSSVVERLQATVPMLIGLDSINIEVMKVKQAAYCYLIPVY